MKLALFFTYKISLENWIEQGIFDREKLVYEALIKTQIISKIYWFTYGRNDNRIARKLKSKKQLDENIHIIPMPVYFLGNVGKILYSLIMPFIHSRFIKDADILKTNQVRGSLPAYLSKLLYKKKLIVRCGYMSSQLSAFHKMKYRAVFDRISEFLAFNLSDIGVVSSNRQREYLFDKYWIKRNKIDIVPNYIDTSLFFPDKIINKQNEILFIGRISKEKNLYALCDAVNMSKLTLHIVGKDMMKGELQQYVNKNGYNIIFDGVIDNSKLPHIYNKYKYFVIPSFREGMPKSLIEAMACGMVCIGTDVPGINDIIQDGENGYLAKSTNAQDIHEAIIRAMNSDNEAVMQRAFYYAKENFSLESVFAQESRILQGFGRNLK